MKFARLVNDIDADSTLRADRSPIQSRTDACCTTRLIPRGRDTPPYACTSCLIAGNNGDMPTDRYSSVAPRIVAPTLAMRPRHDQPSAAAPPVPARSSRLPASVTASSPIGAVSYTHLTLPTIYSV